MHSVYLFKPTKIMTKWKIYCVGVFVCVCRIYTYVSQRDKLNYENNVMNMKTFATHTQINRWISAINNS